MKIIHILLILFCSLFVCGFHQKLDISDEVISSLLFRPDKILKETPSDFGLRYKEVSITTENGRILHGWYILDDKPTDKNIIYLHGSKGNASLYLGGIKQLHKAGANILIVDYEGFGNSDGKASIKNTITDAIAMYDYLIYKQIARAENISLFGYSYGGAIAIELALKRKVHAILLESTFSSLRDIATAHYSFLALLLVPNDLLNSKQNIQRINVPVIIAYAGNDQIIPIVQSKNLFTNANSPKYLFEIKNAQHHNIFKFVTNEYIKLIKKNLV